MMDQIGVQRAFQKISQSDSGPSRGLRGWRSLRGHSVNALVKCALDAPTENCARLGHGLRADHYMAVMYFG